MENTELQSAIDCAPMSELAKYHQLMMEKYKNFTQVATSPDAQKLIAFNGYYTLNTAPGAFLAVDANVHIQSGSSPIYDLALLISLDGTTSYRVPFTGTFNGTQLTQQNGKIGQSISLTFTHTNGSDGTTAICSGNIKLQGSLPSVNVSGATYNNPIPVSLFIGEYYNAQSADTNPKVMSIRSNDEVWYDYGANNGVLKPVPTYVYNMNMYYFSFMDGSKSVGLIMGTAAEKGFACNNMISDKETGEVTARSLETILAPVVAPGEWYDISGCQLAGLSGYYQVPSIAPLAFVSIQAQYCAIDGVLEVNTVMITISMDGKTSNGYLFDPLTMTFENSTLTMPGQHITLTFDRTYNPDNRSLVTLTGTINGKAINGYTLFNPVPLSVFGGVALTNKEGKSLTITNDNQVTYDGTIMENFIYVPLMYILAYPIKSSTVVMSFGTDGLKGNACIVTENPLTSPATYFVYAIPGAS